MQDSYGRKVHSMRISVTDRCNMRCNYCVSGDKLKLRPLDELLTLSEIENVIVAATSLGFDSFRFTGGEPLVRRGILGLLEHVGRLAGVRKLSLSTNGSLLARYADRLVNAGVKALNISLDSLNPSRFRKITRGGNLSQVLEGINAALTYGSFNVKLNACITRGINEDELLDLAELTLEQPLAMRFIEYMPFGAWQGTKSTQDPTVSVDEMLSTLRSRFEIEENVSGPTGEGPARYVQIKGAAGFIGLISPVNQPFCDKCNRIRLTSDGHIKSCLLHDDRFSLREWMRSDDFSMDQLADRLTESVMLKPKEHQGYRNHDMSTVGG
ncbi:MAG: GTP 3',8-cyclase MoaA [Planctomycetota bacterium]